MTNYEKLFGTPERAAESIRSIRYCAFDCDNCEFGTSGTPAWCELDGRAVSLDLLLEWLESEVRDD